MDFNKVRVISFAIRNRLAGYHLVENPKWKSPYYVKMIKINSGIATDTLDTHEFRYIKSRNFSKKGEKTDKKVIMRKHYMFWSEKDNQKIEYEMPVYIHDKSDGTNFTDCPETEGLYDRLKKRDTSYIRNTLADMPNVRYSEGALPIFCPYDTIAERYTQNFYKQRAAKQSKIFANSFWSTLRANLRK